MNVERLTERQHEMLCLLPLANKHMAAAAKSEMGLCKR